MLNKYLFVKIVLLSARTEITNTSDVKKKIAQKMKMKQIKLL